MSRISKDDVEHAAQLSRVKLNEAEAEKYNQELEAILDYVAELEEAPTENVEVIKQISNLRNIHREDKIEPSLPTEKILENAPEKQDNFIEVKKVFE